MNFVQTLQSVQSVYKKIRDYSVIVIAIADLIHAAGGTVLAIGGAVRDCFLDIPLKDLDCEVYGLTIEKLEHILQQYGPVRSVGKAFGVLRIDGLDVDWSLPRRDAEGRKPTVTLDMHMQYVDACRRRDLTINAIGINMHNGELVDPCSGLTDLQGNILRSPDITQFAADPLRLYRVMQFVSRFEMRVDAALSALCATMDVAAVSRERIEQEWHKMLLLSTRPSLGIRWLESINRLYDLFPELQVLKNVPQRADYHPEGDVFEHTMQTLDAAAQYAATQCNTVGDKKILLYAALCHDLGKPLTTVWDKNRWRSPGHAHAGVAVTRSFLRRITREKVLMKSVCTLVEHHMAPGELGKNNASDGAYKKLAMKLYPHTNLKMLSLVCLSDRAGRNADGTSLPLTDSDRDALQFQARVQGLGIWLHPESPVITGDDLSDMCPPGPKLGMLLRRVYAYQIKHGILDREKLKKYAVQIIKTFWAKI